MKTSEYILKTKEEHEIQVYEWLPDELETVKGLVQISHGMSEHGNRYKYFAEFLTQNGFAVYASDHRGHGKTAGKIENLGFFSDKNGWDKVIDDLKALSLHIKDKYPKKPFFILGHSMGSFLVRKYILNPPFKLSGTILSGTAGSPGIMGNVGVFLTNLLKLFFSKRTPSKLMVTLSFGAYNKKFKPNRTKFDWLSRDDKEVDKYIDDPYCGAIASLQFFNDMLRGLLFASKQANINKTAEDLPVLLFSGQSDPVGSNGRGVNEVYTKLKKGGVKNITLKIFTGGRHEMLNETNKEEVYRLILDWLDKNLYS